MGVHVCNRDLDEVLQEFQLIGWRVEKRTRHVVAINPADERDRLTVSTGRHADPEYIKKARARLRRPQQGGASQARYAS